MDDKYINKSENILGWSAIVVIYGAISVFFAVSIWFDIKDKLLEITMFCGAMVGVCYLSYTGIFAFAWLLEKIDKMKGK